MFNRTTQVSIRTNNGAEAYHRRIGSVMQCAHPTLWIFLRKLIDEENAIHVNILQIKAGQSQRKNKNQSFLREWSETIQQEIISLTSSEIFLGFKITKLTLLIRTSCRSQIGPSIFLTENSLV